MSESSDDTPDWLKQHTETPTKTFIASSSDDDDDLPLIRCGAATGPAGKRGNGALLSEAPQCEPGTAAFAHDKAPAVSTLQQQHHTPGDAGAAPPAVSEPLTTNGREELPKGNAHPTTLEFSVRQQQQQQQETAVASSSLKPGQRKQQAAQAQLAAGGSSIAAHVSGVATAGELPIMLPEKLNRNKVLLELPAGGEGQHYHGAADLSGDSGAVGRIVVVGVAAGGGKGASAGVAGGCDGGGVQLQVDLKGVMYNAWVLPLATTALVLNIGPTEAKVESLFNDFVRLREAVDPYNDEADGGDAGLAYLLDGDDENYLDSGAAGGEGDGAAGVAGKGVKGGAKPRKRQASDKALGGGTEKKPKKAIKTAKIDKKGAAAGKAPAEAKKQAAARKPATEGKKPIGRSKSPAKKGSQPSGKTNKKATAVSQGLGVKGGGVAKRSGTGGGAQPKKQTTLTALAAAAAKPRAGGISGT